MSTLYIRHPARAMGVHAACQYALAGDGGALMQQGQLELAAMGELVASRKRVVLIPAAGDVTLLHLTVPPLAGARLKAALPGLVEDHVLGDPADCAIAAGAPDAQGQRLLAVCDRAWLEQRVKVLLEQGARSVRVVPAQLCLPVGAASLAHGELQLRTGEHSGMGLVLAGDLPEGLAHAQALGAQTVFVPSAELEAARVAAPQDLAIDSDAWPMWIHNANAAVIDLGAALGAAGAPQVDWTRYRWPAAFAALAVLVNVAALNLEWLRMKREAEAVRQSMFQTYKMAFPRAAEPLYPAEQLKRSVQGLKINGGQMAPVDFVWQSAAIGEALNALSPKPGLFALEYRDNVLTVKLRPETLRPGVLDQVRAAMGNRGLIVSEAQTGVWQVRVKEGK